MFDFNYFYVRLTMDSLSGERGRGRSSKKQSRSGFGWMKVGVFFDLRRRIHGVTGSFFRLFVIGIIGVFVSACTYPAGQGVFGQNVAPTVQIRMNSSGELLSDTSHSVMPQAGSFQGGAAMGMPRQVPTEGAMVRIGGGDQRIVGVVQTLYLNAVTQEISYLSRGRTPGENLIHIARFARTPGVGFFTRGARLERASAYVLSMEASRALPGAARISPPQLGYNGFGPFGYVTADGSGSDRCIFAMQDRVGPGGIYDLWLRFCVPGASDGDLTALMRGLVQQPYAAGLY